MSTVEEVLAKAAEWEAAGNPTNAAKLRAHAETLKAPAASKYSVADIEAKAAEWEAAGNPENAAKLRAKAAAMKPAIQPGERQRGAPKGPDTQAAVEDAMRPPRADAPRDEYAEFAAFEAANPELAGRYKPDNFPAPGVVIGTGGGGGKSGGGGTGYTVKTKADNGTFGDTAAAMVEGPLAAAGQFSAGFTGSGASPSREFLANDPLTRGLPDVILTGLGKVGDAGGAALSVVGAGMSGAAGLGAELVPGQDAAGEKKFAEDVTGMAMFAVPELAGVSSVPARMASVAPKVSPVARVVPKIADDVAAADRVGIPVMRSDVRPPQTFLGKVAQKTGESIPIAGTGGMRAKQNAARGDAVKNFISEYVGDQIGPAIDAVTEGFRKVHSAAVKKYATQKNDVINGLDRAGVVPVPKAVSAIDAQIAKLKAAKNEGFAPIISELESFKKSITDQKLPEIDMNRAYIGEVFKGLDAAKIRDAGEKALSAIYGPLKEDMAGFIKQFGGEGALGKWSDANTKLAGLADGMKNTALRDALKKGEMTPEVTKKLIFSQKPSDMRLLYGRLDENSRASARTAIVQDAVEKAGGIDQLTPDKFKVALGRLGKQVGVFFKGEDLEAAEGLIRALQLTERGSRAADAPPTGAQALPAIMGIGLGGTIGLVPAIGTGLGIGTIARIYEATGVKTALRRIAKTQNPKVQKSLLTQLEKALAEAGAPSVIGSAQAANADMPPAKKFAIAP